MSLPGGIETAPRAPRLGLPLLVAGVLLLAAGVGALAAGILDAVGQAGALREDAVAAGTVAEGPGTAVAFETPRPGMALYLDFDGLTSNSDRRDTITAAVACEVAATDGQRLSFRGSRQGTATTIGDLQSVGSFAMPTDAGRVGCSYDRLRGTLLRPQGVPWLLTPHRTSELTGAVLTIVGGVFAGVLGGWAAVAGLQRRRRVQRLGQQVQ